MRPSILLASQLPSVWAQPSRSTRQWPPHTGDCMGLTAPSSSRSNFPISPPLVLSGCRGDSSGANCQSHPAPMEEGLNAKKRDPHPPTPHPHPQSTSTPRPHPYHNPTQRANPTRQTNYPHHRPLPAAHPSPLGRTRSTIAPQLACRSQPPHLAHALHDLHVLHDLPRMNPTSP